MQVWTLKKIYFYTVSFVLLMVVLYTADEAASTLAQIIMPEPILDVQSQKINAIFSFRQMAKYAINFLIFLPVYWYHWNVARKLD